MVTLATADPAKFPDTVREATGVDAPLPPGLAAILTRPERFTRLANDAGIVAGFVEAHSRAAQTETHS